jgi:16S rRNA (adenine1518-N6/adenine1519-N6)-dimethyltransferase
VDSAVIRVDMLPEPRIPTTLLDIFFQMAKAGFSQKRKTLRNSLSAGLRLSTSETAQLLEQSGIDPMRRAETLTLDEWGQLSLQYQKRVS